ncbi:hypothetical protein I2I05_19000 [Hymenobacter sp. BT683]|uniref:Uncharacterized protein n=1 Tax=Hymenobacter jeongseonensis TaxID=2791027 RepID=A0ABS0IM88_9BACT|nr:hypothetical protein [Hymenobacter jeongseonensis]MBF9239489.1 hypothetical protein [Hymenobacter jeongseonensis]
MSIETLTTDEFMDLEIEDHQEALRQYNDAITSASSDLASIGSEAAKNTVLDRMARLFTLRKVHTVRLEEMVADDAADAASHGSSLQAAA